jgi:hypothetical protein
MIIRRRVWGALTLASLALAAFSWWTYRAYNAAGPTLGENLFPARRHGKLRFRNAAGVGRSVGVAFIAGETKLA